MTRTFSAGAMMAKLKLSRLHTRPTGLRMTAEHKTTSLLRPNAHISHRASNLYQSANSSLNPFSLVLVGGGPRGALCLNTFIGTLMAHQGDVNTLQQMGAHYDIKVTLIESQGRNELARGNSFGSNHTGISNTGVNWQLVPRLAPSADTNIEEIITMGNIGDKVRRRVQDYNKTAKRIKETNSVAAIMFKAAVSAASTTPNQVLGLDTACLMRKDVGESLLSTFKEFCSAAKTRLPYVSLNVQTTTQVRGIKAGRDDASLSVILQDKRSGGRRFIQADTVHLFTGTTLKVPDMKPTAKPLTYCGFMTPQRVREFLEHRKLLKDGAKLKVASKLLIGGTNLSAIDAAMALEPFMGLVEECPSEPGGYRINREAAKDFAGAVTFVSHDTCRFANPRVSFGEGWRQEHEAFGTSQQLHALFLHEFSQDLCNVWTVIQQAGIARTNGILPSQVCPEYKSTKEQVAHMYQSSLTYFENMEKAGQAELSNGANSAEKKEFLDKATRSLYGARMQAAMNRTEGYGMERDLENVRQTMSELAPLTWGGRNGWEMEKAQLAAITTPAFASHTSNEEHYMDWCSQDWDMSGSPPAMHSFVAKLSEAGVVNFVTARYEDIAVSGDKLLLQGDVYDAFLVAPVFSRDAEETPKTLQGQVTPVHPDLATHSTVGKHRAILSKTGKLLHVEDYGLSGCGAKIQHQDGSRSHLNAYAVDINTLSSAVDTMPSVGMRMAAAAHLSAAGVDDPWGVVRQLFEECLPSQAAYDAEVATFAPFFRQAHELAAFYKLLERVSNGNAIAFAQGYDLSGSEASRQAYVGSIRASSCRHVQEAVQEYDEQLANIPAFNPATRDEYFGRFVDTTKEEDVYVYQRALEIAKANLYKKMETSVAPMLARTQLGQASM